MNQGIYPLAATMINQFNRVDLLSNNLANANTNAFKQDYVSEGSFNNYLKRAEEKKEEVSKLNRITNIIPKIDTFYTDKTLGSITPTNNELDFAIKETNMFFKVRNSDTGETYLTRDGSFNIIDGKLVTKNGYHVLNTDDEPINAQNNFEQQIALVKTEFTNLDKQGNNNYKVINEDSLEEQLTNTDFVLQGALERSNVNSITTMVALIDSHRRLEQAQKAMTGIDDINQKVIDKIGNGR